MSGAVPGGNRRSGICGNYARPGWTRIPVFVISATKLLLDLSLTWLIKTLRLFFLVVAEVQELSIVQCWAWWVLVGCWEEFIGEL